MKKIVIKTSRPEPDSGLIVLLKELFPDCEIDVAYKETEAFKEPALDISSEPSTGYAGNVEF
ncbi:MAG: hypothetical protein SWH54_15995 [Thermodesulfobacteriota bacterium]|nr:hypothetical protein [Thermodesulfobacteriota bacterium]